MSTLIRRCDNEYCRESSNPKLYKNEKEVLMLPAGDLINVQGKKWPKDASCYLGHTGPMCKLCIKNWALNDLTGECTD